jgi:excisionase family DNA binding protein
MQNDVEHDLEAAAKLIGVSPVTLRRMIREGLIGHRRIGRGWGRIRVLQSQLEEYRSRRTFAAAA